MAVRPPIVVVAEALRPAERRLGLRRTTAATAIAALPPLRQPPAARWFILFQTPSPAAREFGRELEGWSLVGGLRARRLVPGGPSSHPTHSCAGRLAAAPHRAPRGAPRAEHRGSRVSIHEICSFMNTLCTGMFATCRRILGTIILDLELDSCARSTCHAFFRRSPNRGVTDTQTHTQTHTQTDIGGYRAAHCKPPKIRSLRSLRPSTSPPGRV